MTDWQPSACILCSLNCGIEVRLGGEDGRRFERIRGDKAHPVSRGYVCQKAGRLDHYQNSVDRVTSPLRRRADGSFEEIDWDTAIREVADRFAAVRDEHGGDKIFYFGGGGQGNHLVGGYSAATRRALGMRYRSNALAQEKTGEFWVSERMMATHAPGDFDNCEVAIFLGKNPWQSHGIQRARVTLREIARDPERCLIVVDPARTESADMADIHLAPRPGTDAWLLAAMIAVVVQEGLLPEEWLAEHGDGVEEAYGRFRELDVDAYAAKCGVAVDEIRAAARRIASAASVSVFEDLGVQMNRHSTLVSYLNRLLYLGTGNFGREGAHCVAPALVHLATNAGDGKKSPVVGAPIISGLTPCNTIPDEILTDHPDRYRAMLVESANPAHSLADSPRMREALEALDFVVVIDVALTETARLADYVLPTPTQYEKAEATFFNFEFPENAFHLRKPLLAPPDGVLEEAEIHARLCEALGVMPEEAIESLREALSQGGRPAFAAAFAQAMSADRKIAMVAPVVLYRTLGETLPEGMATGAAVWALAHQFTRSHPEAARGAGLEGEGPMLGEALFDRILESPSGAVFGTRSHESAWEAVKTDTGRIQFAIPSLFEELDGLATEEPPGGDRRVPAPPRRRRAPLVHGQHHPARSGVAQERRRGRSASTSHGRRAPPSRRRRPRPPDHETRLGGGPRRGQRPHDAGPDRAAERSGARLPRRRWPGR